MTKDAAMETEKKYRPVFLAKSDEVLFERKLKEAIPDLAFVDGSPWEGEDPPERANLSRCQNNIVLLWSRTACPKLPYIKLDNGSMIGPTSGVVIQFIRGAERGNLLTCGDIGVGYAKANLLMKAFVSGVWKVLRSLNTASLCGCDPNTGELLDRNIKNYIVGPGARQLSLDGWLLKHMSTDVYYKVEPGKRQR